MILGFIHLFIKLIKFIKLIYIGFIVDQMTILNPIKR